MQNACFLPQPISYNIGLFTAFSLEVQLPNLLLSSHSPWIDMNPVPLRV